MDFYKTDSITRPSLSNLLDAPRGTAQQHPRNRKKGWRHAKVDDNVTRTRPAEPTPTRQIDFLKAHRRKVTRSRGKARREKTLLPRQLPGHVRGERKKDPPPPQRTPKECFLVVSVFSFPQAPRYESTCKPNQLHSPRRLEQLTSCPGRSPVGFSTLKRVKLAAWRVWTGSLRRD